MSGNQGKRRDKGLADMTIAPPTEKLWRPYRVGTREESYVIDMLGQSRVHHGMWIDGRQIVDFVLSQQVPGELDDEWIDIVRVDCCHLEVHVHRFDADDEGSRKIIRPITCPEDLVTGLAEAETLVYEQWQGNLRRWEHGR